MRSQEPWNRAATVRDGLQAHRSARFGLPVRRSGFSLIELLIVVVASSVIMGGFLGMYTAAVQLERQAGRDLESRYLSIFAQDRILTKIRQASAIVRVETTTFGPVLVYERVPLVVVAGSNAYTEDFAANEAMTGVFYRQVVGGEANLYLRERRPIGGSAFRLLSPADFNAVSVASAQLDANLGVKSRATVEAFLSASDVSTLANSREELVSTDVAVFDLPPGTGPPSAAAVKIRGDRESGIRTFSATFGLTHFSPPPTL